MKSSELKNSVDRKHAERSEKRHRARTYKDRKPIEEVEEVMPDGMRVCDSCDAVTDENEFCLCCDSCWGCCERTDHDCSGEEDGCECPCCNEEEEG